MCCDELQDIKYAESIILLVGLLKEALADELLFTDEQIDGFLHEKFNRVEMIEEPFEDLKSNSKN